MIIERDLYIKQIRNLLQNEQIKIITGIRRCGKSYILNLIRESLLANGINEDNIIFIQMEDMLYDNLKEPRVCHEYIVQRMVKKNYKYYVLIDEVQLISKWEQVVNSLRLRNTSIILTGSNSKILSSELATLLSGRFVQLQLRTISFYEYYNSLKKQGNTPNLYDTFEYYIENGGYPLILSSNLDAEQNKSIVSDIYYSTVLKDVVLRNQIKDEALLARLIDYIFDNVGNLFSIRKVVGYLNSVSVKTNVQTLSNYIRALENAYVIEKASRYDIKGKNLLSSNDKYFVADHSLLYVRRGYSFDYISGVLENIVYNDLKRRGYWVFVGKNGEKEIDFVAKKQEKIIYIQVAYSVSNSETLKREIEPLQAIKDNYKKYIVTMDSLLAGNKDGIEFVYLPRFLLSENI